MEELPYCFSRSSIKSQGHTGRKIDDLGPIWAIADGYKVIHKTLWGTEEAHSALLGHPSHFKVT